MDDELWSLLSQADRALGRLDGSIENVPNPDLFVAMYVRKEAVLSSQIEGTQASLMDVLEFEADALERGRPQDVEEVVNYVGAMNYGLARLSELPVSIRLIREIHERLITGVRGSERQPGELRTSQNWIGPAGCTLETAAFVPPPAQDVPEALGDLERFLHDSSPMPVLLKVGLAHAQFETIHPFLDGNGRVGRLLITFLLCEKEVLKRPLLYLSYFFKQHRSEYYDHLQRVRENGDWEGWLRFFLRGVYDVSQQATETARQIVQLRESLRQTITTEFGGGVGNALTVFEKLFWRPIISVQYAAEVTNLAYSNANRIIVRFEEMSLLRETTGRRRNRRFAFAPYLKLFDDPETDVARIHIQDANDQSRKEVR
jgi:cell filamentation protein, protein adenylyltransferase